MALWPQILFWSDNLQLYRWVYWAGMVLLGLLTWLPTWRSDLSKIRPPLSSAMALMAHPAVFATALVCWIVLTRWPGFFAPVGYNVDEDQHMAALLALSQEPVFYLAADTVTSGPMNNYPLLWPLLFGQTPTLFTMRFTGVLVVAMGLGVLYGGSRIFWSEAVARAGVFVPAAFFASTTFWDFVHQTTEMLSLGLLSASVGGILWILSKPQAGLWKKMAVAFAVGVLLVFVPWAKIQGVGLALVVACALMISLWVRRRSWREFFLTAGAATAGALLVTAAFMGFFWLNGVFDYFWNAYILNSLAYRQKDAGYWTPSALLGTILFSDGPRNRPMDFLMLLLSCMLITAATVITLAASIRRTTCLWRWWAWVGCSMILATAVWTLLAPSRPFSHYLLYTVIPLGLWIMAGLGLVRENVGRGYRYLILFAVIACTTPIGMWRLLEPNLASKRGPRWRAAPLDAISLAIAQAAEGGNGRLTVWGYNPVYHTQTRLAPATRISSAEGIFFQSPTLRDFYLQSYLADLQRMRPGVFADVVAPNQGVHMYNPDLHAHEQVPEIAEWVAEHYELVDSIDGVRIFRARDLFSEKVGGD